MPIRSVKHIVVPAKSGYQEVSAPLDMVPLIKGIHTAVYEACRDKAFSMDHFHSENPVNGEYRCGSSHCRAGWVVALAGKAGVELERWASKHFRGPDSTETAARLIYERAGYTIDPFRFYVKDDDALAHMKRLAQKENRRRARK